MRCFVIRAEIQNKITKTGSNLSDRLEDKLTGDVFGAIRYLPFECGFKHFFTPSQFYKDSINNKWRTLINQLKGYDMKVSFWPRNQEGEIDILMYSESVLIGIEVKYLSGLSSIDPEVDRQIDYTDSIHQLSRYSRMLNRLSEGRDTYLLFLAPYTLLNSVKTNMSSQNLIYPKVQLGFLCWEDILQSLSLLSLDGMDYGHKLIIQDVIALLVKKDFVRYKGFENDLFNKLINKELYYSFKSERRNIDWTAAHIKEDLYYVFNY